MLIVVQETLTVDIATPDPSSNGVSDSTAQRGPPAATLARRAKSYSDFYDAVRGYLEKEQKQEKKPKNVLHRQQAGLRTESEFAAWYGGVKCQLEDASHEEYQYVAYQND
jgi:conserved oligomeric Golgi complex subunit 3